MKCTIVIVIDKISPTDKYNVPAKYILVWLFSLAIVLLHVVGTMWPPTFHMFSPHCSAFFIFLIHTC